MKTRPLTVAACQGWLDELTNHPPGWWQDTDNQIEVLDTLAFYRKIVSPNIASRVKEMFARQTGITVSRVESIFELPSLEDVRTAIQYPGPREVERVEEGSELYPTTGWIGEYIHYTQGSEIPMAWHFWFGVALIGAALRRNMYIRMGTFRVDPCWYMMLIEETASAKSTAFGIALDVLRRAQEYVKAEGRFDKETIIASPSGTVEAFLEKLATKEYGFVGKDGRMHGGWTESVAVLPVDELVTLLGKSNFNPGAWVQFLTGIWEYRGETWVDSKVGAGDRKLYRPGISFWAGSTLSWLKLNVTAEMFDGGFLGRFIFIKRRGDQKEIYRPPDLDPIWANDLARYLAQLQMMNLTEFKLTGPAHAYLEEWYHSNKVLQREWEGDKFQAYYRRKQSHLMRLVMCMAMADSRGTGTFADCELAVKILSAEEENMGWIFSDLGSHPNKVLCDYILQYLAGRAGIWVPFGVLLAKTRHRVGSKEALSQLLATLTSTEEVDLKFGGRGGAAYRISEKALEARRSEGRRVPGLRLVEASKPADEP